MTNIQSERTDLMAKSRITSYIGTIVALGFGYILPTEQVGMSFTTIAQIVVVIAVLTMVWLPLFGKEHLMGSREKEKSYTIREMFRYLAKNKYLLIFFGGLFLFSGLNTALVVIQFAAFYLFDNAMLATVIVVIGFAPSVILSFFLPALLKRFDKMKMLQVSAVAFVILSIVIWAVGPVLMPHLILSVFRGFALGGVTVLQFMFTPDCAEYGQYKTGTEARGITFAVQTFTMKLNSAVQSALALAVLGWFGWKSVVASSFAELAELGVTQSESAMTGLWTVYSLIPTIGGALAFLVWTRYKLRPSDVELMAKYNNGVITREECDSALSVKY
jgi:Na+/melibiose symporter-like transporter